MLAAYPFWEPKKTQIDECEHYQYIKYVTGQYLL